MAVTGLILVAYLITHVLANLLVFTGPDRINRYAAMLHATGGALWAARLVLLVAVILHIVAATQLALRRQAARPVAYAGGRQPQVSTLASRTIRWGGALLLVFIIFHILHFTIGTVHPDFVELDPYHNVTHGVPEPAGRAVLSGRHGGAGPPSLSRRVEQRAQSGRQPAEPQPAPPAGGPRARRFHLARVHGDRGRGVAGGDSRRRTRVTCVMELNARIPAGPIERKWDKHRFEMKLVNPANKRKYTVLVVGSGLAGAQRRREHERARLPGEVLLLPGLAPAGPQHRRAGRDQRRQELPERRRQHLPPVLRHGEGRRLPRPRGQRLPAGPDQRQHHRPVRRAGRAVRPGVRRAPGQPLVRRGAGLPHLLRAGPDRAAAPARRLSGAGEGGRPRRGDDVPAHRDARSDRDRRSGPRHRGARHGERGDPDPPGRRGGAGHRRLRQRVLPLHQRQGQQRHRHLAGLQARARRSPTPATPRSTRPAFR